MITEIVSYIILEGVIPAEWILGTIVNCYNGKENYFERGNYKELKLENQVLVKTE